MGLSGFEIGTGRHSTGADLRIHIGSHDITRDSVIHAIDINFSAALAVQSLTGHSQVNVRNIATTPRASYDSQGRFIDYYIPQIRISYSHDISGISVNADLVINGIFRTVADLINALQLSEDQDHPAFIRVFLQAGGNNDYTSLADFHAAYPETATEIVCVDTTNQTSTTITIEATPSSTTITTVDGDPPYLANVSTTEPTSRGVGDLWYNPTTGTLSVWTGSN